LDEVFEVEDHEAISEVEMRAKVADPREVEGVDPHAEHLRGQAGSAK
jgi:hypothetical protein